MKSILLEQIIIINTQISYCTCIGVLIGYYITSWGYMKGWVIMIDIQLFYVNIWFMS